MTALTWDDSGKREFETGVDQGVLYIPDSTGDYTQGYAWNGLTKVSEAPSGASVTKKYADNINYLSLVSAEEFAGTISAYTYPDEFGQCDGTASPAPGVSVGQQARLTFGLSYRTKIGNDIEGQDFGYRLHLAYGGLAEPSQKDYATINDSPDAIEFSWKFSTTPVQVPGLKPSALLTIDSTKASPSGLAALEAALYGGEGSDPRLPQPKDVIAFFSGTVQTVSPVAPQFDSGTKVITIPSITGVIYKINGVVQAAGPLEAITTDTVVTAEPDSGYSFPAVTDTDWYYAAE